MSDDFRRLAVALAEFRSSVIDNLPRWLRRLWRLEVK